MRVLVTGASGFVGVNVVGALLARGHEVTAVAVDAIPADAVAAWGDGARRLVAHRLDVRDAGALERLMRDASVEAVWHGAAITAGADREVREAGRIVEVNALAVVRALEAAARAGAKRFVYPSSSAVYGETAFAGDGRDGAVLEDERPRPLNLYGITKAAAEQAVLHLGPRLGLAVCAGRINAVFGPWERDTGLRDTLSPHLQMAGFARNGREAVLARGAERDWVYAPDVADAFVAMLEKERPPAVPVNITPGALWPLERMAVALAARFPGFRWRYAGSGEATNLGYGGPIDRPRRAQSAARIRALFGWSAQHDPDAACADYARWVAARSA
jgi:nucleoside-diphosphate-sugar epimerase